MLPRWDIFYRYVIAFAHILEGPRCFVVEPLNRGVDSFISEEVDPLLICFSDTRTFLIFNGLDINEVPTGGENYQEVFVSSSRSDWEGSSEVSMVFVR